MTLGNIGYMHLPHSLKREGLEMQTRFFKLFWYQNVLRVPIKNIDKMPTRT